MSKSKPRPPAKPKPKLVPLAALPLFDCGLPFSRGTLYRWAQGGYIQLLHIGGKTLISAETVAGILDGTIQLPANNGRLKKPEPQDRGGWTKKGKRKAKAEAEPEQPATAAE